MGKFFNHYIPDHAVGLIPIMSVELNPGTTRSGIAATTWTWSATSRYGWSEFIRDARNCRSSGAAKFKATIKRKRCSKQNGELTLYFWRRRQLFRMLVRTRVHHRNVSAYGTKQTLASALIPAVCASTKLYPPRSLKGALMRRREAARGAVSRGSGFASPVLGRRRGSARVH